MKRLLWLGIGLAVGALVVRAVARRAEAFTPRGIAGSVQESAGGMLDSVRSFVADVRDGMAERESQIHRAFADGMAIDDVEVDEFEQELRRHEPRGEDGRHELGREEGTR